MQYAVTVTRVVQKVCELNKLMNVFDTVSALYHSSHYWVCYIWATEHLAFSHCYCKPVTQTWKTIKSASHYKVLSK